MTARKTTQELGIINIDTVSLLKIDDMFFGYDTKKSLKALAKRGKYVTFIKVFLMKELQKNLPYENDILRWLQYVYPDLKTDSKALTSIRNLASAVCSSLATTEEMSKLPMSKHLENIEFEFKVSS